MQDLANLTDRYVEVWNEADPDARRRRIRSIWSPNGTTCHRLVDARGYEAIEARVTGSWDRWLRDGKYVFRAVEAASHHDAVKFEFAMIATSDGTVEANGLCYLLLDGDGRIANDYQFNPSTHDAVDLAGKYLAPWNQPDLKLRQKSLAELWAEDAVLVGTDAKLRDLGEISDNVAETQRRLITEGLILCSDRSQRHHDVAHIGWRIAPGDDGAARNAGSTLLIFNEEERISAAYQYDERVGA
jgi:hypothetical protein